MIIETIVSTIDTDEKVNFSPFGIKKNKNQIYISPYIPSRTLLNLQSTKLAVVNYTDNTSFFVDCIIGNKEFKYSLSFINIDESESKPKNEIYKKTILSLQNEFEFIKKVPNFYYKFSRTFYSIIAPI